MLLVSDRFGGRVDARKIDFEGGSPSRLAMIENTRRGWLRKAYLVAVGTDSWTMIGP
jgi:hypothetical protein